MSVATVDVMPPSLAVETYLDELRLLRKSMTVVSAQQILEEYLTFADPSDIRGPAACSAGCHGASQKVTPLERLKQRERESNASTSVWTSTLRSRAYASPWLDQKSSLPTNSTPSSKWRKAVDSGCTKPSCNPVFENRKCSISSILIFSTEESRSPHIVATAMAPGRRKITKIESIWK
jgi:hypothetical protein